MKKNKILCLMAALLLMGCASEQEELQPKGDATISLGYNVAEVQTRAATNLNDGFITSGEAVKVLIRKSSAEWGSGTDGYEAAGYDFLAGANGALNCASTPEWPTDGSSIDIMAYYPSTATETFVVSDIQTDTEAGNTNYKASDLMVAAPVVNQFRTNERLNLQFHHKMAKVIVKATPAEGSGITLSGIKLVNVKRQVTFTPTAGTISDAVSASEGDDEVTLTVSSTGSAALIPPQTISGRFIEVTTSESEPAYFSVDDKVFQSGHQYTITLNVNSSNIGTTNAITDWTQESISDQTGTPQTLAELSEWINSGKSYDRYLGWYVTDDGYIYQSVAAVTDASKTAIGLVAYMAITDVDTSIPGSRVLVLSLSDVATATKWSDVGETSGASPATDVLDGYYNTVILNGKYGSNYAAGKCWVYTPTISGGSKWFLPSYYQWSAIKQELGENNYAILRQKTGMTTTAYWTSTEFSTNNNTAYRVRESDGELWDNPKNETYSVRACFAYPCNAIPIGFVTNDQKGWYITTDGYAYRSMASAEMASKTVVAAIVYTGNVPGYFEKFIAVALEDANGGDCTIYPDAQNKLNTYANNHAITYNGVTYNTNAGSTGSNCYDIVTGSSGTPSNRYAADNITLKKGWRIPTVTDWRYIFEAIEGISATNPVGIVGWEPNYYGYEGSGEKMKNMGGLVYPLLKSNYFSSSQTNSDINRVWGFNFNRSIFGIHNKDDDLTPAYIRACFAF